MALQVEGVVNGGMDAEKPLCVVPFAAVAKKEA